MLTICCAWGEIFVRFAGEDLNVFMTKSMSCAGTFADNNSAWCSQTLEVLAKTNSLFLTSAAVQNQRLAVDVL